eukprot:c40845_g1_i1.p1 GENE.c40845_g1_i1~~c40845_g1_i1.p1  ORF type:complete len:126 (-),score=31.40 c40845_g1_i1:20-358(-)
MRIVVFAEFQKWEVIEKLKALRTDVELPLAANLKPTQLLGKETPTDPVLTTTVKLFYTPEEELAGVVDEVVSQLQTLGCTLISRRPYRENIIDAATQTVEREYCNDRVILSA